MTQDKKESLQKRERPIVAFWSKHKKTIQIASGVVGTGFAVILTVLGVKYYWNATSFEKWFKEAPLDEIRLRETQLSFAFRLGVR